MIGLFQANALFIHPLSIPTPIQFRVTGVQQPIPAAIGQGTPWTSHQPITETNNYTRSNALLWTRIILTCVFGCWEEAGIPPEKPTYAMGEHAHIQP